jgi:hypothetical protein
MPVHHYGFGKALQTSRFGSLWRRFRLFEHPEGYVMQGYYDPCYEKIECSIRDRIIHIQDVYYHVFPPSQVDSEIWRCVLPKDDYLQIVLEIDDRYDSPGEF